MHSNAKKTTVKQMFPKATPDAIDLMEKCLQFNPDKRCSAEEALAHPYVRASEGVLMLRAKEEGASLLLLPCCCPEPRIPRTNPPPVP